MSPNTFNVKRRIAPQEPVYQYRPEELRQKAPEESKELAEYLSQIFRKVFDYINEIRNVWTPLILFAAGGSTADDVDVPVQADAADRGTSFMSNLTFSRPGKWLVTAAVNLSIDGDTDVFTLSLLVNGTAVNPFATWQATADTIVMMHQQWLVQSITGTENVTLRIKKAAGAGASVVVPSNSTMSAVWEGTGE